MLRTPFFVALAPAIALPLLMGGCAEQSAENTPSAATAAAEDGAADHAHGGDGHDHADHGHAADHAADVADAADDALDAAAGAAADLTDHAMEGADAMADTIETAAADAADPAYVLSHTMTRIEGTPEPLSAYAGKVLLIVNTASKCGFTRQYDGLQALYEAKKDEGLVVLGFPSDNFGGQEFDTNAEVVEFCRANFGVEFPMFEKVDVKGDGATPLFRQLAEQAGGEPRWNFTKYLVGRDGKVVGMYGSSVEPDSAELTGRIDELLEG